MANHYQSLKKKIILHPKQKKTQINKIHNKSLKRSPQIWKGIDRNL